MTSARGVAAITLLGLGFALLSLVESLRLITVNCGQFCSATSVPYILEVAWHGFSVAGVTLATVFAWAVLDRGEWP